MKTNKIIGTILFLIISIISLKAQKLPFQNFNFEGHELKGVSVHDVFIDKDGFYWLGCGVAGLIRWDGVNAEFLTKNTPVVILKIWQDDRDYIWFTGRGQIEKGEGLYVSNRPVGVDHLNDTLYFSQSHFGVPLLDKFTLPYANRFTEKGEMVVSGKVNNIVKYHYDSDTVFVADTLLEVPGSSEGAIHGVIPLPNGKYVYTYFKNKIITHTNMGLEGEVADTTIVPGTFYSRFFFADSLGGIWGGNGNEFFYFSEDKEITRKAIPGGVEHCVKVRDDYFIGANNSGLFDILITDDEWKVSHYNTDNGLASSRILNLTLHKNKLWISHVGGFSSLPLDFKSFELYDKDTNISLSENNVISLNRLNLKGRKDILVAGTNNGLNFIDKSTAEVEVLNAESGMLTNGTSCVITDNEKRIWTLDGNNGSLNCIYPVGKRPALFKSGTSVKIFESNYEIGTKKKQFNSFFLDELKSEVDSNKTEQILLATNNNNIYFVSKSEKILSLGHRNNFANDKARSTALIDEQGYIYATSTKGLYRSTFPWTIEVLDERLSTSTQSEIVEDHFLTTDTLFEKIDLVFEKDTFQYFESMIETGDELWISDRKGVLVYSIPKAEVTHFIPTKYFSAMLTDADSLIYCGTSLGLAIINKSKYKIERYIRYEDGMHGGTSPSYDGISLLDNGDLYFGTKNGLNCYSRKIETIEEVEMHCYIRNFEYEENLFGDNSLEIDYVSFGDLSQSKLFYKTRLKGFNEEWSDSTTLTSIDYMNLKAFFFPKTYEFEFKAYDYREDWHQLDTPLTIVVNPPIWFRWWAFIIYGIIGYFIVKWLIKRQLQNLRKSMLLKEAEVIKGKNIIIQEKVEQNELLIKEIHHRVKNNLQTISSLLHLQSASISDDDAKMALHAVKQRVESMALIHKKLYEENDLSQIEMDGYIKLLVENLIDSFGFDLKDVKPIFNIDKIHMEMDQAIPIGLLITELVTNSLKYAFPERKNGKLWVELEHKNGVLKLFIKDNGAGKKENVKESFGSKLIKLLTRQLEGSIESGSDKGYWTCIKFNLALKAKTLNKLKTEVKQKDYA